MAGLEGLITVYRMHCTSMPLEVILMSKLLAFEMGSAANTVEISMNYMPLLMSLKCKPFLASLIIAVHVMSANHI